MRTTVSSLYRNIITNLNSLSADLLQINNKISSGKNMSKISDEPLNLVSALGFRSDLSEINQFKENITYGDSLITGAESSLSKIKEQIMRAKELNIQSINGTLTPQDLDNMAFEVRNLLEESVTLANTQLNGKFIFGGYRTTGYNNVEPKPFLLDQIDGYRINGVNLGTMDSGLTGTVTNAAIPAGALEINGNAIGGIGGGVITAGLNMGKAANARTALNAADPTVTATLTTLYAGGPTAASAAANTISFDMNGITVTAAIPGGTGAGGVAGLVAAAVNSISDQTGVQATVGDNTNGGAPDSIVLTNMLAGDESAITITNLTETAPGLSGLANGTYSIALDPLSNTGQITISSSASFMMTSPIGDDSILQELGLGGGGIGFADEANDGELIFGTRLAANSLTINGYAIPPAIDDGISTSYSDISAAAKANAINSVETVTQVTANVVPVYRIAQGAVEAGTMDLGDLIINGVDIITAPTAISLSDNDNALLSAINAQQTITGIAASRDATGRIVLSATDGRNLHIQTSANGERITHLNGGIPATPQSRVYFGDIQLVSGSRFVLDTTPTVNFEPGLAALGMAGGGAVTGESNDTAGDGHITVQNINEREGEVRYTGDRFNEIEIKVGQRSTLAVSMNGQDALMNTGVFSTLQNFEDYLRGQNYTAVVGTYEASNTGATLDSGNTGLELADEITTGSFAVTVTDHDYYPPIDLTINIAVDPAVDTPASIAQKINGVPGLTASWNSDGFLEIRSIDPDRYTCVMQGDTSNFLRAAGVTPSDMQIYSLSQSLADMDQAMDDLTKQISDFGARANRIEVQRQIYIDLEVTTSESLSDVEDTDMIKALMDLKTKEIAYEAALSAAAKTMQLSLVDFL